MLISILVFKICLVYSSLAEWIDMPQFSDESKVYRMSNMKQDEFYKFVQKDAANQFPHAYQNVTYKDIEIEETAVNESERYNFDKMTDNTKEPIVLEPLKVKNVTDTENYDKTTVSSIIEKKEDKQYFNESLTSNDTEFFNYLPVDILKNVHRILKTQPTSSEGKLQYLKTFENTLISAIESRLVESLQTSVRKKRGNEHYDHGYDHENAAGFPSIEGALMAISFLTFAVYLVKLVMLFFRNMNNTATSTMGTVFIGRRRRSLNKFDDDIATILEGLHRFSSEF